MNPVRYRVLLEKRAQKHVAKLDKPIRRRIQAALISLADNPRPPGAKALTGRAGVLRLRVGDFGVIYTVRDNVVLVVVIDIDHRSEAYR
ncbi:type II toxin-antitoxin system RelE family toxin [Amycolatopsis anabasis]|uniref:type II toxin-antitoxin system RelE family toxin n=1 Tax=Amycolatopsis anabasis TaxID=1840409 RepID=UPI00131E27E5|nr:type II toxin-antitoxin system RelE/ParE family toxin [Amycolatopsis anabasis]